LLGLLGTNPEGWRLDELTRALDRVPIRHTPLYPWLFSMLIRQEGVEYFYDSSLLSGPEAALSFDLIYVIALGYEELQEVLYKTRFLSELDEMGTRIVNSVDTIAKCRNKVSMTLELVGKGIKMPETMITESVHLALEFIMARRPCVLKPITGLQGRGLTLIPEDMREGDVVDYVSWFQSRFGRDVLYVQEFVEHPGYDIRALVVGGKVVSKMRRFNPESWRTNISAGARPLPSDDEVDDLALAAAGAVGGEIVGVDILPLRSGEFSVLEVNSFPGWKGLQEVSEIRIADAIAEYLSSIA
jgi:RimK family alpha-L-glutamate ligase